MRILIICTGNSCRSQMAHGYLQSLDGNLHVFSAGTKPAAEVNPFAIEVMKEKGINISAHKPHSISEYSNHMWDYVITVCSDADAECPMFNVRVSRRLHIGFEDPAKVEGTPDVRMAAFRKVRDEIFSRFKDFYSEIATTQIEK